MNRADQNQVQLTGKISRIASLRYTPSGVPMREAVLAVSQDLFEKHSVGYLDLLFVGEIAEQGTADLRIGSRVAVKGSLWNRVYRDRKGLSVSETKVVVQACGITRG